MDRQCSSCGGFCKKSGCERENVQPPQHKEWVGLTYKEQEILVEASHSIRDAINRTNWKLKEKNG